MEMRGAEVRHSNSPAAIDISLQTNGMARRSAA